MVMPWYLSNLAPFCICVDSYFCSCCRSTELDADACWCFACTVCVGFGAGGAGGGGDDGGGGGGDDGGGGGAGAGAGGAGAGGDDGDDDGTTTTAADTTTTAGDDDGDDGPCLFGVCVWCFASSHADYMVSSRCGHSNDVL